MKTLRIIFALLRVPRLICKPASFSAFRGNNRSRDTINTKRFSTKTDFQLSRSLQCYRNKGEEQTGKFLRTDTLRKRIPSTCPATLCLDKDERGVGYEQPPSKECAPDRLDIALHVPDSMQVDLDEYLRLIEGDALRLHVCKKCSPDLELFVSPQGNSVKAHSAYGLMLYTLLNLDKRIQQQYKELKKMREDLREKLGDVFFLLPELKAPIAISSLEVSLIFILNITALVVIALWLGLRAHRKILDYFSKSGALLPMVAATGKTPFLSGLMGYNRIAGRCFFNCICPTAVCCIRRCSRTGFNYRSSPPEHRRTFCLVISTAFQHDAGNSDSFYF